MTQTTVQTLDIDELLRGNGPQIIQLLTTCFSTANPGTTEPEALTALLDEHHLQCDAALTSALQQQLPPGSSALSSTSYALVVFTDQLFSNFHKNNQLHNDIHPALNHFRAPALISLCRGELPWGDKRSPVRFMAELTPLLFGWQPELGRAADKFRDTFSTLVADLAYASEADAQATAHEALLTFFEKERQRIEKLEQRLHDSERGQLLARHAQQLSAKTLNQQMGGKKLPASISRFLQGPWRETLRLTLLNAGHDSEQWRTLLRLTETLIWSVQPIGNDAPAEQRQHIYDSISELSEQLRDIVLQHPNENHEASLAEIEAEHLKILKGENLNYQPFNLIDNTNPLLTANVSISKNLIKNVDRFNEGQWFLYHSDDGDKRIKLSLKIDTAQQLLFTNLLGIKAEQFSIEEFAFMLSSKTVVPLMARDIFRATGEKMLQSLLRHYQSQQQIDIEAAEREAARHQAREKALQEAQAHTQPPAAQQPDTPAPTAPAPTQRPEPATPEPEPAAPNAELQAGVEALVPGAIVAFRNTDDSESSCRLAAILKQTGDYIFVNKQGLKEHVLKQGELADRIAGHRARIVNQGYDIKGSLEEVVNNFRTRKSP